MFDIGVYAYLRALFFHNNDELGERGILGQPPRLAPVNGKKAGILFNTRSESAAYLSGVLFSVPPRSLSLT